ncbi:MAG: PfkB family carbohydrate kinase [Candidatus Nanoarchaeia archaeon]
MNFDIITLGSATVDVFASSESQLIKLVSSHSEEDFIAFRSGDKILVSDLKITTGGGGTNTAVSFSRLGLKTGFCGVVGKDIYAKQILDELSQEEVTFLGTQLGKSGYSVIFDSVEHDRVILAFKGSNNSLSFEAIKSTIEQVQTKWVYSSSVLDESFSSAVTICSLLKKKGARIAWNPSLYQTKLGPRVLQPFLSLLDVLILNKEEAKAFLQTNKEDEQISALLKRLQKHTSATYIIITDGKKGAFCSYNNNLYFISPSPNIEVKETTGAGDAFASGFVTGLSKNYSCEDALTLGMLNSEHVISAQGAKTNLLHAQSSHKLIPSFKGKILKNALTNAHEQELDEQEKKVNDSQNKKVSNEINKQQNMQNTSTIKEKTNVSTKEKVNKSEHKTNNPFILKNADKIYSLEELYDALRTLPKSTFMFHVNNKENHFAQWIRDCFILPELAQLVAREKTKIGIQLALKTYIDKK